MAKYIEGNLQGNGYKIGIIVARFNSFISEKLLEGALDTLVRSGVQDEDIDVARVPGAFEIPLATQKMAKSGKYDAIICIGVVIRGATPHFDFVANEVLRTKVGVMTHLAPRTSLVVESEISELANAAGECLQQGDIYLVVDLGHVPSGTQGAGELVVLACHRYRLNLYLLVKRSRAHGFAFCRLRHHDPVRSH